MATPSADYPVGKPVTPPPGAVRAAGPQPPPCRRLIAAAEPEPVPARAPVNWFVVGVAGGLAVAGILGLALLCLAPRRAAPPVEVAAGAAPAEPVVEPAPAPAAAVVVSKEPAPEAPRPPAAPEPGTVKPAGSAPPAGLLPGPAPAGLAKGQGEPAPFRFKRRDLLSAVELSRQLLTMPELDLDAAPNTSARVVAASHDANPKFTHPVLEPLLKRTDLHGLPLAMGADCQLGKESAQNLQVLSRKLRAHLSLAMPADGVEIRLDAGVLRQRLLEGRNEVAARPGPNRKPAAPPPAEAEALRDDWTQEDALPTLVQMLQAEDRPVRLVLVELLANIKGRAGSAALVQRALFDLSADVREAAVRALRDRPRDEYRQPLLDGLCYPWPPAADHAAEALVGLDDREAVPRIAALLREPDPVGPVARRHRPLDPAAVWTAPKAKDLAELSVVALDDRQGGARRTSLLDEPNMVVRAVKAGPAAAYTVREVVRVNHLRNCLLCHAPATSLSDPVRGLVPTPGQPLPPPFSIPYYEGQNGLFVRADVTYLRQDFSVPQPVARAGNWPTFQRYDYLVRTRYPTADELRREEPATYPQREAARWALAELGGVKEGTAR
jgi:hypothetical protein